MKKMSMIVALLSLASSISAFAADSFYFTPAYSHESATWGYLPECGGNIRAWYSESGKSLWIEFSNVRECKTISVAGVDYSLQGTEGAYEGKLPSPFLVSNFGSELTLTAHSNSGAHSDTFYIQLQ